MASDQSEVRLNRASGWTDRVTYSYTSARLRNQMIINQPSGTAWTSTYAWDAGRRLQSVTSPAGTHSYVYSGAGGLTKRVTLPGSLSVTNEYDGLGRLWDTQFRNGTTILNRHGYAYNAGHQRTTLSRTNSNSAWNGYSTATYDNAGEVREVKAYNAGGVSVPAENFFYGYDAGWNLLKRTNNAAVTTYTPNVLNQAAGTYDQNGNRTAGAQNYTYDAEDQLVSVEAPGAWRLEFVYDGRKRLRIIKDYESGGGSWLLKAETRLIYDGLLVVQERSSAGHPRVTYTRGRDLSGSLESAGGIGGLLSRSDHATSGTYQPTTHAFYHADGNGNVTYLSRTDGTTVGGYKYDPFGRTLSTTGTLASGNLMRFSSKPWIQSISSSSGLYAYGYRFYDPVSQRWLNRDPIMESGGFNLYAFALNRSLELYDLWGLDAGGRVGPGFPNDGYVHPDPKFEPDLWSPNDNCLSYALNRPGRGESHPGPPGGWDDCKSLIKQMKNQYRASEPCKGKCDVGYHKIKVYTGFHFQREDGGGGWSEKELHYKARTCKTGIFGGPLDRPQNPNNKPGKNCGELCVPN
ncbi:MAG: RHS repeat-associated core domain-containing protein [Verrucomicrobia bacterium]|nr:RHS repeat-associated core domain-containing protein [Verrucomicrobiota bacterium]